MGRLTYFQALPLLVFFFCFFTFFFRVGLVGCFVALLVCRRYANRFGIFFSPLGDRDGHAMAPCSKVC